MKQPKLVRDFIPQIIQENPERTCDYYIAGDDEYEMRLFAKMKEELQEFIDNPCYEEAADMYEVLCALCKLHGLDIDGVESAAMDKREARGAFFNRIVLERVD
tara:strand:+ start:102 stop:410 length:309 start_codon:yes stop_codon:yes gene_type:complete